MSVKNEKDTRGDAVIKLRLPVFNGKRKSKIRIRSRRR